MIKRRLNQNKSSRINIEIGKILYDIIFEVKGLGITVFSDYISSTSGEVVNHVFDRYVYLCMV